ncbi:MAG: Holliday junction branch migration DNA helicase RuvB, partial [Dongiaceae bacterium]
MNDPRVIAAQPLVDDTADASLRPQTLAEFVGQQQLRDNLGVFIAAARARRDALD